MENKYITVAYKLYVMQDGQKTLVEEATVEHPFQFISGLEPHWNALKQK